MKWFHYLPVVAALGSAFLAGVAANGFVGGVLVMAMLLTLIWSIFRYAAHSTMNWFADHLPEIPWVGSLYLRWFRPDTYYRQDVHAAFVTLVDSVIQRVIAGIEQPQSIRPSTREIGGPVRADLHTEK